MVLIWQIQLFLFWWSKHTLWWICISKIYTYIYNFPFSFNLNCTFQWMVTSIIKHCIYIAIDSLNTVFAAVFDITFLKFLFFSENIGWIGTLILSDICIRMAKRENKVDFLKYLHQIYLDLPQGFETYKQYWLACQIVLEYLKWKYNVIFKSQSIFYAMHLNYIQFIKM